MERQQLRSLLPTNSVGVSSVGLRSSSGVSGVVVTKQGSRPPIQQTARPARTQSTRSRASQRLFRLAQQCTTKYHGLQAKQKGDASTRLLLYGAGDCVSCIPYRQGHLVVLALFSVVVILLSSLSPMSLSVLSASGTQCVRVCGGGGGRRRGECRRCRLCHVEVFNGAF
ncbi:hypothetical protein BKA80DRAFT_269204 [Phyllosticta citrichinensis]